MTTRGPGWQELVELFHARAHLPVGAVTPIHGMGREELVALLRARARYVLEEAFEFVEACGAHLPRELRDAVCEMMVELIGTRPTDLVGMAHELADVQIVVLGAAVALGIDLDPVLREVMRANFAKLEGGVRRRADGKVLKPEGWSPPNVARVVSEQGFVQCLCDPPGYSVPCPDCGAGC